MQRAVRRVVHQDREPELAAAEKDDREQPRGRILRPGRKTDECEADDPGVCDEPDTAPRRGARQRRPLGAVEEAVGRQEADGRHRASVTSFEEKLKCFDCGDEADCRLSPPHPYTSFPAERSHLPPSSYDRRLGKDCVITFLSCCSP